MKKIIYLLLAISLYSCCKDINSSGTSTSTTPSPTPTTPGNVNDLTDLSFFDANTGIIVGTYGYIAKTNDGGSTWTQMDVGTDHSFLTAFMLSSQNYFCSRIGIYKTTDNGAKFNECSTLSTLANSIFAIHFFNSSNGIVLKGKSIMKTTDGGQTWVSKYNEAEHISDMEFPAASIGYVSGGISYDGTSRGEMHKSIDGGETWRKILTSNSEILALDFINERVGFYATFSKEILSTIDGGVTWSKISEISDLPISMSFVDNNLGYISTNEGKIMKTTDGAKTWKTIYEKADNPISKLITIQGQVYAVGNNGLFLKFK